VQTNFYAEIEKRLLHIYGKGTFFSWRCAKISKVGKFKFLTIQKTGSICMLFDVYFCVSVLFSILFTMGMPGGERKYLGGEQVENWWENLIVIYQK
jgi:hypothetical protein